MTALLIAGGITILWVGFCIYLIVGGSRRSGPDGTAEASLAFVMVISGTLAIWLVFGLYILAAWLF